MDDREDTSEDEDLNSITSSIDWPIDGRGHVVTPDQPGLLDAVGTSHGQSMGKGRRSSLKSDLRLVKALDQSHIKDKVHSNNESDGVTSSKAKRKHRDGDGEEHHMIDHPTKKVRNTTSSKAVVASSLSLPLTTTPLAAAAASASTTSHSRSVTIINSTVGTKRYFADACGEDEKNVWGGTPSLRSHIRFADDDGTEGESALATRFPGIRQHIRWSMDEVRGDDIVSQHIHFL